MNRVQAHRLSLTGSAHASWQANQRSRSAAPSLVVLLACLSVSWPTLTNGASFRQIWDIITEIGDTALASDACPGCSDLIAAEQALPSIGLCALVAYATRTEQDVYYSVAFDGADKTDRINALDSLRAKVGNACGHLVDPPATESAAGAKDPNDKVGSQGAGQLKYISGQTPLRYIVDFGNQPAATAPAQAVVITDQLDIGHEDLQTFSLGAIAIGTAVVSPAPGLTDYTTTFDLRPQASLLVQVTAHLDISSGLLVWRFSSLDPFTNQPPSNPTTGFLPPGSNGSVMFGVMPKQRLTTGTQIQNQASIVFDANPPMATQVWGNTIDNTAPTSKVTALPAVEASSSFAIQWSGTDAGAGIQDYTIYVSDNGAPFTAVQTNTTATSATFTGQVGHTYSFYSIARDLVGNVEAPKTLAEASTRVVTDVTPPVTTASVSPGPNASGWNNANVIVTLMSTDNEPGGTGVRQITYSATGGQTIASTVVNGASASVIISIEGITALTFFGTDYAGNSEAVKTLTIKLDKTPPAVACSASPNVLWPPNNKLVPVNASVTVTDSLSGPAGFNAVSVTSNEADSGLGDIQGFVVGTPSTSGQLRAQRLGSGVGRVYTLTYGGADRAGNSASCVTTVSVPHDQGH